MIFQKFELLRASPFTPLCTTVRIYVKNYCKSYWFISSRIVNILLKPLSRIDLVIYLQIYKSALITSLTGFDIAFTNAEDTLKQRLDKVISTLFQCCFNVGHWRCINFVQRWKSDVGFCFIFNVGSTLFQRWSTTLKQRWSDVEILAGYAISNIISSRMILLVSKSIPSNQGSQSLKTCKNSLKVFSVFHFFSARKDVVTYSFNDIFGITASHHCQVR